MAAKSASLTVNIIAEAAKAKAGLREAETAFGKFRREVGEAQGAMGKFRTVSNAAFTQVKQNAVGFAATAGTAIAAFVAKSVNSFAQLALSASKFSNATGLSIEQASRFIEAAGDIGIESNTVEAALNRLNRAVASGAEAFSLINAEIVRTSSGATDVQATFFNVIDALRGVEDPALRAQAATALLGRGWQGLARIVDEGSGVLQAALDGVDTSKIMTEADAARAKAYERAVDNLKDTFEEFSLTVGEQAVPAATGFLNALTLIANAALPAAEKTRSFERAVLETAASWSKSIPGAEGFIARLINLKDVTEENVEITPRLAEAWSSGYRAMIDAQNSANGLFESLEGLTDQTELAKAAWDEFTGGLSLELEMMQMEESIAQFNETWTTAMIEGTVNADEFNRSLTENRLELARFAEQIVLTKNAATQNVIKIAINTQPLERAYTLLMMIKSLTLGFTTGSLGPSVVTPYGAMPLQNYSPFAGIGGQYGIPGMASGGLVSNPTLAVVGEAGPEVVIPLTQPERAMDLMQQTGLASMATLPMGQAQTIININAGSIISENDLIETIRKGLVNAQRNGAQLVY